MKKNVLVVAACCAMVSAGGFAETSSVRADNNYASVNTYVVTFPRAMLGKGAAQFQISESFTAPNCTAAYYGGCTSFNGFQPTFNNGNNYSVERACSGGMCTARVVTTTSAKIPLDFLKPGSKQFSSSVTLFGLTGDGSYTTPAGGVNIDCNLWGRFSASTDTLYAKVVNGQCSLLGYPA